MVPFMAPFWRTWKTVTINGCRFLPINGTQKGTISLLPKNVATFASILAPLPAPPIDYPGGGQNPREKNQRGCPWTFWFAISDFLR